MPDAQDYTDLAALLACPEKWSAADARQARLLRDNQAAIARGYDQREQRRVASMWTVVGQLDDALARWQAAR